MLHVPTLSIVAVFVTTILGALLLFAWRREQNSSALLWWGSGYLLGAISFALLSARRIIPDVLSIEMANTAVLLSYGFMFAGARAFHGRDTPLTALLVAPLIWLIAMQVPAIAADINLRIVVVTLCQCALISLMVYEFWSERAEPLLSRWPTIIVLLTQMVVLTLRLPAVLLTPLTATHDFFRSPTFAVMAFSTVLYTITFAFLLLSMTKERGELRHKRAALIDPLTGLANRRAFLGNAAEFMSRGGKRSEPLTVMLADLDRFKAVNDRFGHAIGDHVLQLFADTVTHTLRANDLSGRLGGEEFAFLLSGTDAAEAARVAERIRIRFAEAARSVGGKAVASTASIGVATTNDPAARIEDLMAAADHALYRAKAGGRNRIAVIDCGISAVEPGASIAPAAQVFALSALSRSAA
ncbi:MAG: GGDEF domain-containing protein [Alphaproteobacteria bacterium]|nr:MAG: GGDEF domain-containing protein [Alphaproteobacteria bacterium]